MDDEIFIYVWNIVTLLAPGGIRRAKDPFEEHEGRAFAQPDRCALHGQGPWMTLPSLCYPFQWMTGDRPDWEEAVHRAHTMARQPNTKQILQPERHTPTILTPKTIY